MTSKEPLRKTVKKLMVDHDLDYKGAITDVFAPALGIRRNAISMALTGHRDSEHYQAILRQLYEYLSSLPPKNPELCRDEEKSNAVRQIHN